jgi:hypothetical protein
MICSLLLSVLALTIALDVNDAASIENINSQVNSSKPLLVRTAIVRFVAINGTL